MKLRAINVPTPDTRRFAEFYQKALGASVDESHGGPGRIEIWFGDNDDDNVLIVAAQDAEYIKPKTSACQGFEFHVPDADAIYAQMREMGITVTEPPRDVPWGYRFFHINDPDGNGIDIVQAL